MSTHYYADGATHNDHHKELNINGSITPEQLRQLARRFLDEEAEEADEATPEEAGGRAEEAIPHELDTPQARDLWRLAREQGWVDERLRPRLPSDNQAAVLADVMADALALSPRWAPFERLWGIKDLVHKHSQAKLCAYYDTLRNKMKFELN